MFFKAIEIENEFVSYLKLEDEDFIFFTNLFLKAWLIEHNYSIFLSVNILI